MSINPKVSVIIPVYNDKDGLKTTVKSVLDQNVNNYEVVIVDNNSDDGTFEVAKEFEKYDRVVLTREKEIQSSYAARNKGIKLSSGQLLAFIDADMWVNRDWIENIISYDNNDRLYYAGCNVQIESDKETIASMYNKENGFRIKYYLEDQHFAPTCCLIVQREVFDKVGLFNEYLISSGDYEFGQRVNRAGYPQSYLKNIIMYHPARVRITELINKKKRIGFGQSQCYYKCPSLRIRHPLDLRGFLPVRPQIIHTYPNNYNIVVILQFYLLENILKLSTTFGKIQFYFDS